MATEYVSKITLIANGQEVAHLESCTEMEREVRTSKNLMRSTGFYRRQPRYQLQCVYAIPAAATEFDFEGLENGTIIVEYEGGRRILYSGVSTLTIGEKPFNETDAATCTVLMGADSRREE